MGAINTGLEQTAGQAGFNTAATSIPNIVGRGIQAIIALLGMVLLVLFIYGGYEWMTAGGDSKKVQGAKDRIRNATIGLGIVFASYALSSYILGALAAATGGTNL